MTRLHTGPNSQICAILPAREWDVHNALEIKDILQCCAAHEKTGRAYGAKGVIFRTLIEWSTDR